MLEPSTPQSRRRRTAGVAAGLTRVDVARAIDEWRLRGRDAFLETFGSGVAQEYVLIEGEYQIDALALLRGARRLAGLQMATSYRGDRENVAQPLRKLGFFVEALSDPSEAPVEVRAFDFTSWMRRFDGRTSAHVSAWHRREQWALRASLELMPGVEGVCGLCGVQLPTALLVAAHIKPRLACTADERTDAPWVVMAACSLGCDALFEHGYLSVDPDGMTAVSPHCPVSVLSHPAPAWRPERAVYFAWHRHNRFKHGRVTASDPVE